jgi:hypothetical protein
MNEWKLASEPPGNDNVVLVMRSDYYYFCTAVYNNGWYYAMDNGGENIANAAAYTEPFPPTRQPDYWTELSCPLPKEQRDE